jgi:hypothetical protein
MVRQQMANGQADTTEDAHTDRDHSFPTSKHGNVYATYERSARLLGLSLVASSYVLGAHP